LPEAEDLSTGHKERKETQKTPFFFMGPIGRKNRQEAQKALTFSPGLNGHKKRQGAQSFIVLMRS
jgi:hypothetical protein